jgi:hypothetical protein
MMPAAIFVPPYRPDADIAATPFTNSTSPTGFISSGPSARYMAAHSIKTVETMLWPLCKSFWISSMR